MTNVIPMRKPAANPIACTSCGAQTEAACGCGVIYTPASQRAAEAIAKRPDKSDRAIAAEIGVSPDTVNRVRNSTVRSRTVETPTTTPPAEPPKRTGRDGKARRVPVKKQRAVQDESLAAMMIHATSALDLARMFLVAYRQAPTSVNEEARGLVQKTIKAWQAVSGEIGEA